jgi:hypothetical protein
MLRIRTTLLPGRLLFLLASLFSVSSLQALKAQWITGYYSDQNPIEDIADIPWAHYTHVNHFAAAAGVGSDGVGNGSVSINYIEPANIPSFVSAAHTAQKLALVTIMDNPSYPYALPQDAAPDMVLTFASNIAQFVRDNGYDGVDIDWEENIVTSEYVALLSALRGAMPANVITAAMDPFSNLPAVAAASQSNVDQINIMCYDMDMGHGLSWYNDALFQRGNTAIMSCNSRIAPFLSGGVPSTKIGVGMPYYGRLWKGVTQALETGFTAESTIYYNQLVRDSSLWQPQFMYYDGQNKASFLSIPDQNEFVSYTGPEQIENVVSWAKSMNFGGFMTFALEYEYLSDRTGEDRYPLSTVLYDAVAGVAPPSIGDGTAVVITAPPVVDMFAPNGVLSAFGTAVTLSVVTDINSICRYAPAQGVDYAAMPYTFAVTGGTLHSTALSGLSSGSAYTYFVKCADAVSGVVGSDYPVTFSVAPEGYANPLPAGVTPASGAGLSQTFVVQVSDPGGFRAVNEVDLIVDTPWVGQSNSCWVQYWVPSKTVYLKSDDNTTWLDASLGASLGPHNSQCGVDTSKMFATGSGNVLTVQFPVNFETAYGGNKNIFVLAGDAKGSSSGWQTLGIWEIQ